MAKKSAKAEAPTSGINQALIELKSQGFEVTEHTYAHGFVDVIWTDKEGVKQLREFRPDGSEIIRDSRGREVK